MRHASLILPIASLALAILACGAPGGDAQTIQTSVAATMAALVPTVPVETATSEPTPAPQPLPARLYKPYTSGGSTGWWLEGGTAVEVALPVEVGQFYDFSPVNQKILYASHFATTGAGPGNLAVSDLWTVDYPSGTPSAVIPTDSVVEALWAPDGSGIVYIGATPTTYELRYRSLAGDERLLASNVAPTWGISRNGALVAFTRETGYDVPGAPGLFVVPLAGGPEVMASSADRHGAGSIEDRPSWSFDDSTIALPNWGFAPGTMVIAASDGSFSGDLTVSEPLAVNAMFGSGPTSAIWHPDGTQLVGPANYAESMGGPSPIVRYQLDPSFLVVTEAEVVGQGFSVIDWHIPGESFYAFDDNSLPILVTLP